MLPRSVDSSLFDADSQYNHKINNVFLFHSISTNKLKARNMVRQWNQVVKNTSQYDYPLRISPKERRVLPMVQNPQNLFSRPYVFSTRFIGCQTSVQLYTSETKAVWCKGYMTYQDVVTMETFVYVAPADLALDNVSHIEI